MLDTAPDPGASRAESVTCCIAGCGPAGALLGLLLARAGVEVLVLEKHADFFRDFRGDTIHPSTLEIIEELGLLEAFSALPHRRVYQLKVVTDRGVATVVNLGELRLRHPYVAFVPQWDFLDFITDEARKCPTFTLRMEAEVVDTVREDGRVSGVRYRTPDGDAHEVRAALTVAADGRSSALARSAGLTPVRYGAPMDVLWFRISRRPSDPEDSFGRLTRGRLLAMINRTDYWQIGYVIPKGSQDRLRAAGLDALRSSVAELLPFLSDRVDELATWDDVRTLVVQVDRLRRWHVPGLLCIGDAAHAMSPIGGVGINLAIQDAVAAANILAAPLLDGTLGEDDLARVQRRRWLPTVAIQSLQRLMQRVLIGRLLAGRDVGRPPLPLRYAAKVGFLRRIPARLLATGLRPEHVRVGRAPGGGDSAAALSPQEEAARSGGAPVSARRP